MVLGSGCSCGKETIPISLLKAAYDISQAFYSVPAQQYFSSNPHIPSPTKLN